MHRADQTRNARRKNPLAFVKTERFARPNHLDRLARRQFAIREADRYGG